MDRKNRAKSSSLFLLELILAILFFSIASAVCVQIFVKSHLWNVQAQALNLAVSECSGVAEIICSGNDTEQLFSQIQQLYPEAVIEDTTSTVSLYYDHDMQACDTEAGLYCMTIRLTPDGTMISADITMNDLENNTSIYELQVIHHLQREVANES